MDPAAQRFVRVFLRTTLVLLAGVAAFNVLLDPMGLHPTVHLRWFEPLRYMDTDRVAKAELARQGRWDTLVLGSSRSKLGLPATHPFFVTNRTANLGLDSAWFPEIAGVFDFARRHNHLQRVLLCLDLYMFSRGTTFIEDYAESRFNPRLNPFDYACKQLWGITATKKSWDVLRRKIGGRPVPAQKRFGFVERTLNAGVSQRAVFEDVLHLVADGYRRQETDPAYLELFRQLVRDCRAEGIELQIAILPVHAMDNEVLHAAGQWPRFEEWKRDLVEILAAEGMDGTAALWDFTGYAGPPGESIPAAGDTSTRMKYYFESAHFTPLLGGMMLDRMLDPASTNQLGTRLDRATLEPHLAQLRADREAYARTHPDEIAWAERLLHESGRRAAVPKP